MGGAVLVYLPVYQFIIRKRNLSLLNESFETPAETKVDLKLVSGTALFGIGWGMSGFAQGQSQQQAQVFFLFFVSPCYECRNGCQSNTKKQTIG